jgi:hypothetical protein
MMPDSGRAAVRPLMPPGNMLSPPAVKLPGSNSNMSTMMARIGTATFHHVMTLLTLAKMRMARKLTAVNTAISPTVTTSPVLVILSVSAWYRLGQ